jgi:hypothetical protein
MDVEVEGILAARHAAAALVAEENGAPELRGKGLPGTR